MLGQGGARVRFEWGPVGASAVAADADFAVVVDVLSFTTTVTVAVERGIEVFPFRWKDERAADFAREHDATLAIGRFEQEKFGVSAVSLSPSSMAQAQGLARVVLPSPNGSQISIQLFLSGAKVIAASLRNRSAVAAYLAQRLSAGEGETVAVVAAGERWPDGSLRPAVEDLWGAGSVIAAFVDAGLGDLSPEARVAEAAFRRVQERLPSELADCMSGRELTDWGFESDVSIAAELDVSSVVPVLGDAGSFTSR